HNCCIGWEIDIDEDTYAKYKATGDEFGKKLYENIDTNDTPHFVLADHQRCPFLNNHNLCDIIINLGEDHLCQICTDHPRYRNFFDSREEIGLGLCCEAAAELIITKQEKTNFVLLKDGDEIYNMEEDSFFAEREKVYTILQNRDLTVNERIAELSKEYKIKLPDFTLSQWASFLKKLERLDTQWDTHINKLLFLNEVDFKNYTSHEWEIAREQLLIYFVYRHMAEGLYDGRIYERLAFAILCDKLIIAICSANGIKDLEGLAEIARAYSSEIEYSEENLEQIFDALSNY
ncbi:MAG: flagellin lysine-N-methylase, partial [Clostridia bacterium]|nr:flagellin lysine-N-methylase [Clostridia bacterium]